MVGVFSSVLTIALSFSDVMAIGVGAILLFLLSLDSSASGTDCNERFLCSGAASSRSDSLRSLSRRPTYPMLGIPLTELLALWVLPWPCAGVRGGVHIGTAPELAAAILGTADIAGVGAFIFPESAMPGANDEAVAMLETELLLVGLPGLAGMKELGEAGKPAEG